MAWALRAQAAPAAPGGALRAPVYEDGKIVVDSQGNESRNFNTKDGIAVKMAIDLGYNVAIITGANNEGVRLRLNRLGVKNVYINSSDKVKDLNDFSKKTK